MLSSNVIIFMLRGLNDNWKQVIAWHLTTKTSDEKVMCDVILEIISEIEKIGYKVHGLVSDMRPKNQAAWRTLSVKVGKDNNTPFTTHPIRPHESLYIFPDVPHLLKNLRSALMNDLIIKVALTIVQSEGLPCNEVQFRYLEQLEESQRRYQLKLAPNITVDILKPSNFNKMNVAAAAHIFSERTAAALETLVQLQIMERDALTTAWFLRTVRSWFNVMNGRYQKDAITLGNKQKKVSIIDNFLYLIEHIVIGGAWKPVQTGIKISVLNSICLIDKLFKDDYYFFTSRLNQDALENLFSTLRRHGNVNPTPLQVKRCLRLVTLCQFVDTHKTNRNYDCDNDEHYIDFFNTLKKTLNKEKKDESIPPEKCMYSQIYENEQDYSFVKSIENTIQCNVINNVIGSAISYVLRKQYVCRSCVMTLTANDNNRFSIYTNNLSFGFLENPSTPLFKYITTVEAHLQEHLHRCELHP